MLFCKRKIRVRKYRKNPFETYEPKGKVEIKREKAVPLFFRVGNWFLYMGGMIGFFVLSLFLGIIGFFGFRRKTREVFRRRVVEIKLKEKRGLRENLDSLNL